MINFQVVRAEYGDWFILESKLDNESAAVITDEHHIKHSKSILNQHSTSYH